MGTNYYVYIKKPDYSEDFKKIAEIAKNATRYSEKQDIEDVIYDMEKKEKYYKIHIGKSSYGWQFFFNHNNWTFYDHTKESIDSFIRSCEYFVDEYGEEQNVDEFWKLVESKKDGHDGETYENSEIKNAEEAERLLREDPEAYKEKYKYDFMRPSSVYNAKENYIRAKSHNFYEVLNDKNSSWKRRELGYRFADCTEFS